MNLAFYGLVMLCGLASVAFAAGSVGRGAGWRAGAGIALGFGSVVAWSGLGYAVNPVWVGTAAALAALLQLTRSESPTWLPAICGGALAALLTVVMNAQGLPMAAAVPVAASFPVSSAWLTARRANFAPRILFDEALLMVFCLAVAVACAPGLYAGWQSALDLNVITDRSRETLPLWVLVVSAKVGATASSKGSSCSASRSE